MQVYRLVFRSAITGDVGDGVAGVATALLDARRLCAVAEYRFSRIENATRIEGIRRSPPRMNGRV
jgi:hypothetical protein